MYIYRVNSFFPAARSSATQADDDKHNRQHGWTQENERGTPEGFIRGITRGDTPGNMGEPLLSRGAQLCHPGCGGENKHRMRSGVGSGLGLTLNPCWFSPPQRLNPKAAEENINTEWEAAWAAWVRSMTSPNISLPPKQAGGGGERVGSGTSTGERWEREKRWGEHPGREAQRLKTPPFSTHSSLIVALALTPPPNSTCANSQHQNIKGWGGSGELDPRVKGALCAKVKRLRVSYNQNDETLSRNSLMYMSKANLTIAVD